MCVLPDEGDELSSIGDPDCNNGTICCSVCDDDVVATWMKGEDGDVAGVLEWRSSSLPPTTVERDDQVDGSSMVAVSSTTAIRLRSKNQYWSEVFKKLDVHDSSRLTSLMGNNHPSTQTSCISDIPDVETTSLP